MLALSGRQAMDVWNATDERALVASAASVEVLDQYDRNIHQGSLDFTNYMKNEILDELRRNLSGEHSGPEASVQAASLVAAAEDLMKATAQKPTIP